MMFSALNPMIVSLFVVLAVIIPLSGVTEFSLLNRWIRGGRVNARQRFYVWVISFEWALTLFFMGWWLQSGGDLASLNMLPVVHEFQWLAVVVGLGLNLFLILQMNQVLDDDDQLKKLATGMGKLRNLSPTNSSEQRTFLFLSITAGICEEILYRGLLMSALTQLGLGQFWALVCASLLFGLGHAYQGWEGIGKTTLVGFFLGTLALFSGSIYVGMILHAVLDLTSGRILQAAFHVQSRSWRNPVIGDFPEKENDE